MLDSALYPPRRSSEQGTILYGRYTRLKKETNRERERYLKELEDTLIFPPGKSPG